MTSTSCDACDQCNMISINGMPTHEHGCPNYIRPRACHVCGYDFTPEPKRKHAGICDDCREDILNHGEI